MPKSSSPKCESHHICQCKADKLAQLQTENRSLTRKVKKLERLVGDVDEAKAYVEAVDEMRERLVQFCPYPEH